MKVLHVAVATPLDRPFDYLPPPGLEIEQIPAGTRLRLPFGRQQRVGLVLGADDQCGVAQDKLKPALELLDSEPLLPPDIFEAILWSARYYHHPIGLVAQTALPALLSEGEPATLPEIALWRLVEAGWALDLAALPPNRKRQRGILEWLRQHRQGMAQAQILAQFPGALPALRSLQKQGYVELYSQRRLPPLATPTQAALELNPAQAQAVAEVSAHLHEYQGFLLYGVTGSGKTEVYLQLIQQVIAQGRQALILVPEINLTPQMLERFERRFAGPIAILHSRLTDRERLSAWVMAREGIAPIVIGTRSAVWTPLARPGLFIADEEHDASYKQQDGFHYSARDLLMWRARRCGVPALLGTATPMLETRRNAREGRYRLLSLPERAGNALHPSFRVVDLRTQPQQEGFSYALIEAIRQRLAARQQVLIFINRRGFAPALMCHQCGWAADCKHCSAHLTFHGDSGRLHCHHCGATQPRPPRCPQCQSEALRLLGYGTERIEQRLRELFPTARILRIDSDTTRRKYAMRGILEQIHAGEVDILVGTQMLTKGHHFPQVTLVGVINADGGLFSVDFRAPERLAQMLLQVAGRAGREEQPGEVIIQTWHPQHPFLTLLLRDGYDAFAEAALDERRQAGLPPFAHLALLRAEARVPVELNAFLDSAARSASLLAQAEVQVWGPVAAVLERRAGLHRGQILLQSSRRDALHQVLDQWLPGLAQIAGKTHWTLDVDPLELG